MKRASLALAAVLLVVLGGAAAAYVVAGYQFEQERAAWARTPSFTAEFAEEKRGSTGRCLRLVGWQTQEVEGTLTWEDYFVREWRGGEDIEYPVPGVSGPLEVGDRVCGFQEEGYYMFVYVETGYGSYFHFPNCGGNPEAWTGALNCRAPPGWMDA